MKKIGSGWQMDVYEISNKRVLKLQKSYFSQFKYILKTSGPFVFFENPIKRVRRELKVSLHGLNDILLLPNFPKEILGNPDIDLKNLSYTQDMVEPLGVYMQRVSNDEKKNIIILYPELIKSLWCFGLSEKIFNFNLNMGVNNSNELVLVDLGELDFNKEKIASDIKNKRWLKSYDYKILSDYDLKQYYKEIMENEITIENLEKYWKSKV